MGIPKRTINVPLVLVSCRLHGFLDDIYATLVVRLHNSQTTENDELWLYGADFKTLTRKQAAMRCGLQRESATDRIQL